MNYFVKANYSLYILLLILCSGILQAQDAKVIYSDSRRLVIEYKPELKGINEVLAGETAAAIPVIEQTRSINLTPGAPGNLYRLENIALPAANGFKIASVKIGEIKEIGSLIAPVPHFEPIDDVAHEVFDINPELYNAKPADWFELEYLGKSREMHLGAAKFLAARYNPGKKAIEIPSSILVEIVFDIPVQIPKDELSASVLNASQINYTKSKNSNNELIQNEAKPEIQSISDGEWYKIKIEEEGIYTLTADMLSGLGINIPKEKVNTIKIIGNGGHELSENVNDALKNKMNQQEIIVKTKSDGSLESITFYGSSASGFIYEAGVYKHFLNPYTKNNHYLLTWGGEPGARAEELQPAEGEPLQKPTTFTKMLFKEDDLINPFPNGGGRIWMGQSYFAAPIITHLPNLDREGKVNYTLVGAHKAVSTSIFKFYENGSEIAKFTINGDSNKYNHGNRGGAKATINANKIGGDGKSVIRIDYDNEKGVGGTSSYLDYIEYFYSSHLLPVDNEIEFYSDSTWKGVTEFSINSFSGDILGFDVSDRSSPKLIKNISSTGGMYKFKYDLKEPRRFFIAAKRRTPIVEKIHFANLRDETDFKDGIIITHKDLKESAEEFKAYRESNSELKLNIVYVDDIFNEFASGNPDVTAIRDYLAHVYSKAAGKTKYIIFWGDGHFDFKSVSTQNPNYVPTYQTRDEGTTFLGDVFGRARDFEETEMSCFDDYFIRVNGNDVLVDYAIGRINIEAPEQGHEIIEKIKNYEKESSKDSWRSKILLVADDGINGNTKFEDTHTNQAEGISRIAPNNMQVRKIYLVDYPTDFTSEGRRKPQAAEELVKTVNNEGVVLLSWIGHGNPRVWSDEKVFEREKTIPLFTNTDKLFFLTAATCDFGRFDKVDALSGAEALAMSKRGGAIGCFAATRLVYASQNHVINSTFYNEQFRRVNGGYRRLGDAIFAVKQFTTSGSAENDQKFHLLGDPTLKLAIPDYEVKFETINGIQVDTGTVKLKALAPITVKGSIYTGGDAKAVDFNGIVQLSMYDGDLSIKKLDEDDYPYTFSKYGGALNKSSFEVKNGEFTAEFIIPKDISFSERTGRLFAYANSEDDRFARGSMNNFIVNDIESSSYDDNEGPEIKLFLESRDFEQGEIVRNNPLLIVDVRDNTAINTTGLGIGHKIEAWVDDNPKSVDLTPKFNMTIGDNKSGTAMENLFNLKPGMHTVKVRAWDVFNNFSIAETYFNIAPANEVIVEEVLSFPNPFESGASIRFRHNLKPPFKVELSIFNAAGKLVRRLNETAASSYYTSIDWDGLDSSGSQIPAGAYYFLVSVEAPGQGNAVGRSEGSIKIK